MQVVDTEHQPLRIMGPAFAAAARQGRIVASS